MIITSRSNKTAKLVASLSKKKYRDETGLFLVEGKRAVCDVLAAAPGLIRELITVPALADDYPGAVIFSDELMSSVCETVTAQGIAAVLEKPRSDPSGSEYALFLDGVRDPGNLGTLIRTACAAGYNDVYLKDCADAYSGKTVRSTMSAIVKVRLPLADETTPAKLKENGYTLLCADMSGKNIFGFGAPDGKICVVIGGEADGVSEKVRRECDTAVSVPMTGNIESLNAAVSGAILMYEILRIKNETKNIR